MPLCIAHRGSCTRASARKSFDQARINTYAGDAGLGRGRGLGSWSWLVVVVVVVSGRGLWSWSLVV
eukprot:1408350-Alexandrium_andersonii.AAC.1